MWIPWDPDAYKTGRVEFMEDELNQLHQEKVKNEEKAKQEFERRIKETKKKAIEENIKLAEKSGNVLTQTLDDEGNLIGVKETVDFDAREVADPESVKLHNEMLFKNATEKETDKKFVLPKMPNDDEPITLDDILNLWDGIRETPGRIMIISSNHYHDLDPALIRPGRIDITLELSYASHEAMKEIYRHLFDETINNNMLDGINEDFYTPAEIINIYMNEEQDKTRFINRLRKNEHV
jgi:hypothetical protein